MRSRVGQVWELVYKDPPHELVVIVRSTFSEHGVMNQAMVLDDARGDYGLQPGCLMWLGEWDDGNGWRRVA